MAHHRLGSAALLGVAALTALATSACTAAVSAGPSGGQSATRSFSDGHVHCPEMDTRRRRRLRTGHGALAQVRVDSTDHIDTVKELYTP